MRRRVASEAKPNPVHFALAGLESMLQDRLFVCTQNVDSLHEQAGSRKVVHMHGELFNSRCDSCNHPPFDDTNLYDSTVEVPRCECGGRIRPHVCWFGEVPFELDRIYEALRRPGWACLHFWQSSVAIVSRLTADIGSGEERGHFITDSHYRTLVQHLLGSGEHLQQLCGVRISRSASREQGADLLG